MTPERFRVVVSLVLTIGVAVSAILLLIGFVGAFLVGWEGSLFGGPPVDVPATDFGSLAAGLAAGRPASIAQLGLIVLIATPIVRVVTSLVGFAMEGDRLYVAITGVVLVILAGSILLVH